MKGFGILSWREWKRIKDISIKKWHFERRGGGVVPVPDKPQIKTKGGMTSQPIDCEFFISPTKSCLPHVIRNTLLKNYGLGQHIGIVTCKELCEDKRCPKEIE